MVLGGTWSAALQGLKSAASSRGVAALASNTNMHSPQDDTSSRIEDRLVNLEIKASYTEDLLDSLNEVVVRQQRQIDLLLRELARLAEQGPTAGGAAPGSPRDELPPHY